MTYEELVAAITQRRNECRYWATRLNEAPNDLNTLVADVLDDILGKAGAWTDPPEFEV